jgi:hypothetical protein
MCSARLPQAIKAPHRRPCSNNGPFVHPAFPALPLLFPELELLDLAGGRLGPPDGFRHGAEEDPRAGRAEDPVDPKRSFQHETRPAYGKRWRHLILSNRQKLKPT